MHYISLFLVLFVSRILFLYCYQYKIMIIYLSDIPEYLSQKIQIEYSVLSCFDGGLFEYILYSIYQ